MKKAMQRSVRKASDKFYGYRELVLSFKDPEDLHQMRVAGRTLLSFMYLLADDEEAKSPKFLKVRRPLKKAMGLLGALRDADVMLEEAEKRLPAFSPEHRELVEKWLEHKREERETLRADMAEKLPQIIDDKWKERMDTWTEERVRSLARKSFMVRKIKALRNEKALALIDISHDPAPDLSEEEFLDHLHKGRISVKRLRYALETMRKFTDVDKAEIDALKSLQDRLGHIQDLRVWTKELEGYYGSGDGVCEITSAWRKEMLDTLHESGILSGMD